MLLLLFVLWIFKIFNFIYRYNFLGKILKAHARGTLSYTFMVFIASEILKMLIVVLSRVYSNNSFARVIYTFNFKLSKTLLQLRFTRLKTFPVRVRDIESVINFVGNNNFKKYLTIFLDIVFDVIVFDVTHY